MRASFFILAVLTVTSMAQGASPVTTAKIEKARELVLKGERTAAVKVLKEASHEPGSAGTALLQAWQEIVEVFLTDKGQNQFSLAESIWLTKPKDALDVLTPLLKIEDGNLQVSRLGARSALRSADCVRAEAFVQQAELTFPSGGDVRLLRLQVQDCANGTNSQAPALKLPSEGESAEIEGAIRLLAVKDALRRKDVKAARTAIAAWETSKAVASENPEFWFWKWKTSVSVTSEMTRDRIAARKYLGLCSELTPRRRKNFAAYPELCQATETVESDLKSSDKAGT